LGLDVDEPIVFVWCSALARRILLPFGLGILGVTALLVGTSSATADSGTVEQASGIVISGHGFGHGIGLSQWGAEERAVAGQSYQTILAFYYPGTALATTRGGTVRILLAERPAVRIGSSAPFTVSDAAGRIFRLPAGRFALGPDGRLDGRSVLLPARVRPGSALLTLGATQYRGTLDVEQSVGGLSVVNAIALEDYVADVVSSECPGYWRQQALRAQAVASRTYALANLHPERAFDLYPDDRSQSYHGLHKEFPTARTATAATKGQVLRYNGRLVNAFFSAANGGRTSGVEGIFWDASVPYLVSKPDVYDARSPDRNWGPINIDLAKLRAAFPSVPNPLTGVDVARFASGRASSLTFTGLGGTTFTVDGYTFQQRLGLRSTLLTVGLAFPGGRMAATK
jgi:stage II sporulation protein D